MTTSLRWLVALVAVAGVACGGNGEGAAPGDDTTETPPSSDDAGTSTDGGSGGSGGSGGGAAGSGGQAGEGAGGGDGGGAGSATDAGPTDDAGDTSDASSPADAADAASDASDAGTGGDTTGEEDAGVATDAGGATDDAGPAERVRIVAANLTSGNKQSYDPGDGIRILQGLDPDIFLLQEMNYGKGGSADVAELVAEICGAGCASTRGKGDIPNGVVSRYPILDSGEWTDPKVGNRDFVWARIDVPGPTDLWAVSVHLLTTSASNRAAEAASLVADLKGKVPKGDFVVVGGDFNTAARTENALDAFSDLFETGAPYPVDQRGNGNTNSGRSKPYDWVLASPALHARATAVVIGASTFSAGLVVDTRIYEPLTDIAPARSGDSAASNMQHMAVVRDFLLE